jgi:hypothetical protein
MGDPSALLATFAARERALALEGRLEELALLAVRRAALTAELSAQARVRRSPPGALKFPA